MRYLIFLLSPQVSAEEVYFSLDDGIKADSNTVFEDQGTRH